MGHIRGISLQTALDCKNARAKNIFPRLSIANCPKETQDFHTLRDQDKHNTELSITTDFLIHRIDNNDNVNRIDTEE